MLCCQEIFFYALVLDISRFSRVFSETRFMTKRKEIDVKSVFLNLGRDKIAGLPGFHTFSGADIMGFSLSNGKKVLVIFQKGNKVINKAFAALVTTIKLTNETIARLEKHVCFLYEPSTKIEKISGLLLLPLRQNKHILRIFL